MLWSAIAGVNTYTIFVKQLTTQTMKNTPTHTMQYFSKWRNEWIDFTPTEGELIKLKKMFYQVRNLPQ